MENALFIGLSKQIALQTNMDIVANNVANMNTAGFRGQNMLFKELVEEPRGQENELSYVIDFGQYDNTSPGPIIHTNNKLDVGLVGPGFMGVNNNGEIMYTRAGDFKTDPQGVLVNPSNMPIASQGGGEIVIPENTIDITISETGGVFADGSQVGQLLLAEFENPQNLRPVGNVLYTTEDEPIAAQNTIVKQGTIEGSNVNPIVEVTNMISVLREYQSVQSFIGDEDERLRSSVRELLRTN